MKKKIKLQIWDTAGQETFRSIVSSYYRGAHGIIFVCDITNWESFSHIEQWINDVYENTKNNHVTYALIANKIDILQIEEEKFKEKILYVPKDLLEKYAEEYHMFYMETSAKTGFNINEIFQKLVLNILEKEYINKKNITINNSVNLNNRQQNEKNHHCCF